MGLLEEALEKERDADGPRSGPWFNGAEISLVDCAHAPFLQRFRMTEPLLETGLMDDFPLVSAWTDHLIASDLVTGAVPPEFPEAFKQNHERRGSYVWSLMQEDRAAAE